MTDSDRKQRSKIHDLQNYQSFTGLACSRCKANGVECDLLKPCSTCISLGVDNECSDGDSYSPTCYDDDRSNMLASITKMEHDDGDTANDEKDLPGHDVHLKDFKMGSARAVSPDALLKALMNFDYKAEQEKAAFGPAKRNEGSTSFKQPHTQIDTRYDDLVLPPKNPYDSAAMAADLPECSHSSGKRSSQTADGHDAIRDMQIASAAGNLFLAENSIVNQAMETQGHELEPHDKQQEVQEASSVIDLDQGLMFMPGVMIFMLSRFSFEKEEKEKTTPSNSMP